MDEATKKAKVSQFVNDKALYHSVVGVLREVFSKKSQDRDVNNLASRFLALELLTQAEMEMSRYAIMEVPESTKIKHV
jgi:hypothetical protein